MNNWLATFDRAFPRLAFARHLNPASILHRLSQRSAATIRRTVNARPAMARISPQTTLRHVGTLPPPVMPPRRIAAERTNGGWIFTLLNRTIAMPAAIDWTAPSRSANDQLWRMTLHYMEYLESIPPDVGAEAIRQWITANPVSRDGATSDGWNSYALSIRLVCWLQWLARNDGADALLRETMAASMKQQIAYLLRHLERDIGGNHLIKNIKALLWSAASFDGPDIERWHAIARRLLWQEIDRQILADGVHYERSPAYHAQVTADLIDIFSVLSPEDQARLQPTIVAMVRAAHALAHPDGLPAQFNDCGLTMAYRPADLSAGAQHVGIRLSDARTTALFPDAGFLAWHDQSDSCIAKLGPIAANDLPAHGHGDIGSFELSVGGLRCIVDQGVFAYYPGERRTRSRSCAAHNVTQVGDLDQAHFFGAFRMGWRANISARMTVDDGGMARAVIDHDGFDRVGGCGMITRSITVGSGNLTMADQCARAPDLPVCTRLLIHPDWAVTVDGCMATLRCGAEIVRLSASFPLSSEAAEWWPDMGESVETIRLVMLWPDGATAMSQQFDWHDSTLL